MFKKVNWCEITIIPKKIMKKRWVIVIIIVVLIVLLAIENRNTLGAFLGLKPTTSSSVPEVDINYGNIEQIFSGSSMIKDLPKDSVVLLKFYNFDTGQREWEKSYVMKTGEVKEGYTDNADLIITIHSEYLEQMTNKNFCSMIKTANANGGLGIESELSKVKLLWKFKSMLKYRDCFGF